MELRYLRIKAFYAAMNGFSRRARRVRMAQMVQRMQLRPGQRVLDLGGLAETWREAPGPLDLTVLNLPGTQMKSEGLQHRVTYVEGDACDVAGVPDRSFDVVFSNSVIEHVGNDEQQQAFAREVRRLGRSYWVQTPSVWFPIEAHTGMPFWWFYPESLRGRLMHGWQQKLPEWTEMVRGTRVLKHDRVRSLFPEARIYVERLGGIPKSYTAWLSTSD
jgi:hypothetical protein